MAIATRHTPARARSLSSAMPLRLKKKAARVVNAIVEEVNVARGVGARTDKRGNAKTSLWDRGKVRRATRAARLTRGRRARGGEIETRSTWTRD